MKYAVPSLESEHGLGYPFPYDYIYIYIYILKWIGPRKDLYFLKIFLFLHRCMFPAYCFRQRTYMAQDFVSGVINETWTHLCLNGYHGL